jgi:hypothetical protein
MNRLILIFPYKDSESPEAELESKILRAPTKRVWGHGID